jgi:hypothetical protein
MRSDVTNIPPRFRQQVWASFSSLVAAADRNTSSGGDLTHPRQAAVPLALRERC